MKMIGKFLLAVLLVGIFYRLVIFFFGLRVTSWFRSPWKNERVGGMWNSLHMIGWAFDVVPANEATASKLRKVGLKTLNEGDHIHAQVI